MTPRFHQSVVPTGLGLENGMAPSNELLGYSQVVPTARMWKRTEAVFWVVPAARGWRRAEAGFCGRACDMRGKTYRGNFSGGAHGTRADEFMVSLRMNDVSRRDNTRIAQRFQRWVQVTPMFSRPGGTIEWHLDSTNRSSLRDLGWGTAWYPAMNCWAILGSCLRHAGGNVRKQFPGSCLRHACGNLLWGRPDHP